MSRVILTPEQRAAALAEFEATGSWPPIAERHGMTVDALRKQAKRSAGRAVTAGGDEPAEKVSVKGRADGSIIVRGDSRTIRTVPELLEAGEVDEKRWQVKRWQLSKHDVPMKIDDEPVVVQNFRVWAELVPWGEMVELIEEREAINALLHEHAPRYDAPTWGESGEHLVVIQLVDVHLGMLAWAAETGEDYNSQLAREAVEHVVDRLLAQAQRGWSIGRVAVVIGSDLIHADWTIGGSGGTTTKGTPQDVDSRPRQMKVRAFELALWVVDRCRTVAPVDVRGVSGNHAAEAEWELVEKVRIWYRHDDAVTVDNPAGTRSYYLWQQVLLGFGHLRDEKDADLAKIMPREAPDLWGRSVWRDWLGGDYHRIKVHEDQGVGIRHSPGLTARDAHAAKQGWAHRRGTEALIYEPTGFVGLLFAPPPREGGKAA